MDGFLGHGASSCASCAVTPGSLGLKWSAPVELRRIYQKDVKRVMTDKHSCSDDPIRRNVEKNISDECLSPMDPPDAYAPPGKVDVDPERIHPFLKELMALFFILLWE